MLFMYASEPINKYLSDLAARQPTPGGGSAAALCGAIGTALLEMVCNFTVGNKKYSAVEKDMQDYLASLARIHKDFTAIIDEDVTAYSAIRDAFKTKDKKIIDNALKNGYDICLKICKLAKEGVEIAIDLPDKGNINLVTDVGCGAELLNASFNSGVFNCEINLNGIGDTEFVEKERASLDILKKEIGPRYKSTITKTKERMK